MPGNTYQDWCFTLYDRKWRPSTIDRSLISYYIMGLEVCPKTLNIHWQGYCEANKRVGLKTIMKAMGMKNTHFENREGSQEQAINYCIKDEGKETFARLTWGSPRPNNQGQRSDLIEIKNQILDGLKVDTIVVDRPTLYHQYGRTLHKIEDLAMRKRFRTQPTQGIWYYGPTGCGKSMKAFENYDEKTHYVYEVSDKWWDDYTQQDIVIIDEFRGEIPYQQLLKLTDRYPMKVPRRNRENIPFTSKKIIITSSMHPKDVYKHTNAKDSIKQLLRRFEIIELKADPDQKTD